MQTKSISLATALSLCLGGLIIVGGLVGCGGKANHATTAQTVSRGAGRALFTITWPKAAPTSRLIPQAANSIGVEVVYGGQVIVRKVTVRDPNNPTQQVTFDNLPIASVLIRATAYPTTDGTGTGQAAGTQELVIGEGEPALIALTMGTTIARMAITPPASPVQAGETLQLSATSYDASNAVVLTRPLAWSSSDEAVASVSAAGLVTATPAEPKTAPRTVRITATDAETGTSASVTLAVRPPATNAGPAQFNPLASGNGAVIPGDLNLSNSISYSISSDTAKITDYNSKVIAQGEIVTRYIGASQTPVKYAIFTVAGDIRIGGGRPVTLSGGYPIVLLARGSITIDGASSVSMSRRVTDGPGAGFKDGAEYGGGSFGGLGGGPTKGVYGSDFDDPVNPYLQAGSGGPMGPTPANVTSGARGYGGGAFYIGAVGPLTIKDAGVAAMGSNTETKPRVHFPGADNTRPAVVPTSGGSGGGIVLWSGTSMTLTNARINASGAAGGGGGNTNLKGGGGGRVLIGYPAGAPAPDTSLVNVSGGTNGGSPGVLTVRTFDGF